MYARERQRRILDELSRTGRVTVTELAARFEVTTETLRRDLDQLAEQALLVRVHGGAVPRRTSEVEPDLVSRRVTNIEAKRRIARVAAALLPSDPRAAVLLDAGTTTAELLPHLSGRRGPVITNAPAIAQGALVHTDLAVHVLPGRVRPTTEAAVGSSTVQALHPLHPEVAFLGCNGLDAEGFTTPDPDEAAVKTAMVRSAGRRVVLADSTKIGARHLVSFAALTDIDALITDADPPADLQQLLADAGIEVHLA
ncbi:transcriptional regulator [Brachybacterium avium]|uniref:Lactose phosphotransferase system repressor n=1 Tax=Brachybacterium avium TaxID=2017485 RepID=A0A220UBI1_9MICO|nr:DeoR/GlpR family DNA-binding transcription regulator [Brachybacterium avium]ASK65043.1 transcriptional regulator [Brachybacterium avium]